MICIAGTILGGWSLYKKEKEVLMTAFGALLGLIGSAFLFGVTP